MAAVPLAVERWYDFSDFGDYLGNVGREEWRCRCRRKKAKKFDTWLYGDQLPDPARRDLVGLKARWIASRLPNSQSLNVLDLGCGEGKFLRLVKHERPDAILAGIDVIEPLGKVEFEFHYVGAHDPMPLANETSVNLFQKKRPFK